MSISWVAKLDQGNSCMLVSAGPARLNKLTCTYLLRAASLH